MCVLFIVMYVLDIDMLLIKDNLLTYLLLRSITMKQLDCCAQTVRAVLLSLGCFSAFDFIKELKYGGDRKLIDI